MKYLIAALVFFSSTFAHAEPSELTFEFTADGRVALQGLLPNPAATWDECNGNMTGNYVDLPCSSHRGMADAYVNFLKANLFSCVNAGLRAVGISAPATKVHITHDGTLADENHSSQSLHSAGRAVDVLILKATTAQGVKSFNFQVTSSQPNGPERKFYEAFRQAWHKLHVARKCPGRSDGNPIGTIGWEDDRHRGHHLHTSMPFCPDSNGYWRTIFGDDSGDF